MLEHKKGGDRMNGFFKDRKAIERRKEGPLGPYLSFYAEQLRTGGYSKQWSCLQLRLVSDFSRWLGAKGIAAEEVEAQHTVDYLRYRKRYGRYQPREDEPGIMARLLRILSDHGVIAPELPVKTPSDQLVTEFDAYLENERRLAPATRIHYRPFVGQFLSWRFGNGPVAMPSLRAPDITGFIRCQARQLGCGKHAQVMATALRSFLRFARYRGDISLDLAACIPAMPNWSLSTLPRAISPTHIRQVLQHCDRKTAIGRRDYAILLLLARLGLRGGEVASLKLEDIDWENGVFSVLGKRGRWSQLPLPSDVGKAITAYLKGGRPRASKSRHVFLRARAPMVGFSHGVGDVVKRALARAGIDSPRKGAHQFRHAIASEMLKAGASLRQIGELLRHESPETTKIYAKVDLASLRPLARPWPGGGQ
jgi:site-specific recombinase XerD